MPAFTLADSIISVDHPSVYAVGASQSPGQIGPSFNVRFFPNQATADLSWANFTPPELTIMLGGTEYACLPQQKTTLLDPDDGGVDIEVQYYPQILVLLKYTGPRKHLVYLSCQEHEKRLLEDQYDDTEYDVRYKCSDVYCSNGWTINEIFTDVGKEAGVTILSQLPTLHVPNSTLICRRGQPFLPFLQRLLPDSFRYLWSLSESTLTVSLLGQSFGMTAPPGVYAMRLTEGATPEYDVIEIEGGEYLPGITFSLSGSANGSLSSSTTRGASRQTETLPAETSGEETTVTTQTYTTGLDGESLFALRSRTSETTGPHTMNNGSAETTIRIIDETFSYENDDPAVFEAPRQTEIKSETQQYYTECLLAKTTKSTLTYWLTDDGQLLTPSESTGTETVILSAYEVFGKAEVATSTSTWIPADEATTNWPEGTEKKTETVKQQRYIVVDGKSYNALNSPNDVIQQILSDLPNDGESALSISSLSEEWKEAERQTNKLEVIGTNISQLVQQRGILDSTTGNMQVEMVRHTLNGRVQGNPSLFATQPLRMTIGRTTGISLTGQQNGCRPLKFTIPTNNPTDFEQWATMALEQAMRPDLAVEMSALNVFYPPGMIVGGIAIDSFSVSVNGDGETQISFGGR